MPTPEEMLAVALEEARTGFAEGGIPIGAALFGPDGALWGRRASYRDTTMVTTLAPCWYCSGLIRQFAIPRLVVGESRTFQGGLGWLRELGVDIVDLGSSECMDLLGRFIAQRPEVWNEDIGEVSA